MEILLAGKSDASITISTKASNSHSEDTARDAALLWDALTWFLPDETLVEFFKKVYSEVAEIEKEARIKEIMSGGEPAVSIYHPNGEQQIIGFKKFIDDVINYNDEEDNEDDPEIMDRNSSSSDELEED